MNILGILGADPEVRNGYKQHPRQLRDRGRRRRRRDRRARRPVAEALGRLRRAHQPDQRHGDGRLSAPASLRVPVVIVGAGHAGLAVSRVLSEQSIEHVVLERGEVANTWKTERWDSLRLLTPNWLTRLPGLAYDGEDPDGFMAVAELIEFIERYADHVDAPVRTRTTVTSVSRLPDDGYLVETDAGSWEADAVVVASGAFNATAGAGGLGVAAGRARPGHPARLQASRPAAARPGARRRRLGHRPAARRRAAALRARGDRRRGRARPHAADLPGPRHHVVARPDRPARRALRRGRRPGACAARPLAPTRRNARPSGPRPQRPHGAAAPRSSDASRR